MWMISQHETPDDFVLATGEMRSVRQFIEEASQYYGFNIEWRGEGLDEVGYCKNMGRNIIRVNPKYYRPTEVEQLLGDYTKARTVLGWEPEHSFTDLVQDMCIYGQ
jgi:GDPmannose 4,6-dehydratase